MSKDKQNNNRVNQYKLCKLKSLPKYKKALSSDLVTNVLYKLGLSNNIFDIAQLDILKKVYSETLAIENERGLHRTNASAVKKLMEYVEKGLTYKDFLYDVSLVERQLIKAERITRPKS